MRFRGFKARYSFQNILGSSPAIQRCREYAKRYAASQAPVLIYGATGTGKELFAQAIHNSSPRKSFPFVAINCATLPSELMESELFGYVKGAFTGASSQGKQGLVDQAHLGSLFLDEVDSLSTTLQAKLLRLLQEKEFIRVGGNEVIPVDIRIIAACNRAPGARPEDRFLRQDLLYRLSILYLQLPDLAQRASDISLLLEHFLKADAPELAKKLFPLPSVVEDFLTGLPFPGNLRELQGISARLACLCDRSRVNDAAYLMEILNVCCDTRPMQTFQPVTEGSVELPGGSRTLARSMKMAEHEILRKAKERCSGSLQRMSRELEIGRTTLWRKLKEHGLDGQV